MRWVLRGLLFAGSLAAVAGACDGGGGGGSSSPQPSDPQNPCASASLESEDVVQASRNAAQTAAKQNAFDSSSQYRHLTEIWNHRAAEAARTTVPVLDARAGPSAVTQDVGEIAVLQDEGDLMLPVNAFDLRGIGLQFTRNASGGYDVRRIDATFRATLGISLTLGDDDSARKDIPFAFPFYAQPQSIAFINADGNITFETEDRASTERDLARLLTGPPRVAPFFADLDPTVSGGRVFVHAASDQYTVTWCDVRGFGSQRLTRVQVTLQPNGTIEMKFADVINLPAAIVGVSPGRTGNFTPVDLSAAGPSGGGSDASGERFSDTNQFDTVGVTRKFYRTHADTYDQLVIWTDAVTTTGNAFAYEVTVANDVRGIGLPAFDTSAEFGSSGRLESFTVMDWLGKYPADPLQKFLGENNTVSVLGQEAGHRWLAFLEFRDPAGRQSDALLGRDLAHWSFFLDSDASVMEGNDIEDLGGGQFRTVGAVERYSLLDQYAMGLVDPSAVPPFFYVESPVTTTQKDRTSAPQVGVTITGTRRTLLVQDVIAIHGAREPSAANSPRVHRQAFIFVVGVGRTASTADLEKVDRIRLAWESFFLRATDGRMRAETRLQPPS
jgi:hypothetical protein